MLRWLLVCALVAHAMAASTQKRRAPSWMRLPKIDLPEMPDIQLPEITMPDIWLPDITMPDVDLPNFKIDLPEMPDIQLPEITMPDIWLPDITMPDVDLPNFRDVFTGSSRGAQNQRAQQPQRRPTSGKPRKGQLEVDAEPMPRERKERRRPTIQHREGPPQMRERAPSSRLSTRHRAEPSVGQQVETFREGMPRWMQTELDDTFSTMKQEIAEGRLRMSSWADDISTAAQDWWNEFRGRGDGNTPTRDQPQSASPFRRPSGDQNDRRRGQQQPTTQGNGRQTGWGNWETNRQGNSRWNDQGRGDQPVRTPGRGQSFGRGDRDRGHSERGQSDRGHGIGNWRGHSGKRRWWEGSGKKENSTWCKRPFRPSGDQPTKEEPFFEVLCGGNDYEARLYNASVWVSVTVKALTYDLAVHKAYTKLVRYIKGHNSNDTEIMRTVPVHTKVKTDSRDNRWFECHNYTISFFLPQELHMDPPTPNDPELFIEFEEPTIFYAHTFRGFALEFNIFEFLDELTNTLDMSNETFIEGEFFVNVYDAPWRFFNRRNEILVALNTTELESPRCLEPEPNMTTTAPPTPATTTAAPATTLDPVQGVVPAQIILPAELINPFDNNDLEQESGPVCAQGSECPRYQTAVNYDGFEQRHFTYSRWICMDQPACDFDKAQDFTQQSLSNYFSAEGNREQITMTPTTPLVIGMDVSDLSRTDCGVKYTACTFIPEEHQGAPPTPRDARLYIQDIPAMSRYVKPFGGHATSQNVPKLTTEFLMTLDKSPLQYDNSIVAVAQYTSKPGHKRVNEVWVMDQSLLQGQIGTE